MDNNDDSLSSVQSPPEQQQRDTPSQRPLIPEVCLRLQRSLSAHTMPFAPFAQDAITQFHPQRPNYHAPTQYSTQVPLMVQISPGVWSDGKRKLMSANHPDVKAFLAEAQRTLKLPLPPSEVVFALAALEVFYKPGDPVHWLFWSDDKKYVTADVVNRISLHQPALVRSEVAWNGTPEYLSILANHHGSTWRQFFETKDWYPILVPPKSGISKLPNLRKRKVAPGAMREPSRTPSMDGEQEADEPISKRPRNAHAKSVEKQAICNGDADLPPASPAIPNNFMQLDELTPSDTPPSATKPLPQENVEKKESTSHPRPNGRQQRRRKRTAPAANTQRSTGTNVSSRASSQEPADTTLPAPIDDNKSIPSSTADDSSSSSTANAHLRNRSTSYASAGTLVGSSRGRRSSSVLSASTAVEGGNDKGKSAKHKGNDFAQSKICEADHKSEDADATTNEPEDDESVGVVTRGRARGNVVEKTSGPAAVSRSKAQNGATNSRRRPKKSRS